MRFTRYRHALSAVLLAALLAHPLAVLADLTIDNSYYTAGTPDAVSGRITLKNTGVFDLGDFNQHIGSLLATDATGSEVALGQGNLSVGSDNTDTLFDGDVLDGIRATSGGKLIKVGTGTLTLTSVANDYTGGTQINGGTLRISGDHSLGTPITSPLSFNGGTLQMTDVTLARIVTLVGNGTLNVTGTNAISNIGGAGDFIKSGNGSLSVSMGNTYTGATRIRGGTLIIDDDSGFGVGGQVFFETAGSTLAVNDTNVVVNRTITLNTNATFDVQRHVFEMDGPISGAGSLMAANSQPTDGFLYLTRTNTYSGGTVIQGGVQLEAGADDALGTGRLTLISGSRTAAFAIDGFNETVASLVGDASSRIHTMGGQLTVGGDNTDTTFAGAMDGAAALVKTGTGTFTLSGTNSYTGGTTVNAGTLQGTTDSLQGSIITNNTQVLFNQSTDGTFNGDISGGGGVTKKGTGSVVLGAFDSYFGDTYLQNGTLLMDVGSAIGNGANVIFEVNGGTLAVHDTSVFINQNLVLNANATLDTQESTLAIGGIISGTGTLTVVDSKHNNGVLAMFNTNTYSGGTVIDSATVEELFTSDILGTGPVTLQHGGTLDLNDSILTIGSLSGDATSNVFLGMGQLTVGADGSSSVYNGTIQDGGLSGNPGGRLVKEGAGSLTLSGMNTYSGGTTINNGTLLLGVSNAAGTGSLTTATGGTFDLNGFNQTSTDMINDGTTQLRTGLLTLSGNYSGAGTLVTSLQSNSVYGRMLVAGNLNLTGSRLQLLLVGPFIPAADQTFPIISAASVTGQFASFSEPAALQFDPVYSATGVVLAVTEVPYGQTVIQPDNVPLATILQDVRPSASGDLATVIGNLNTLDSGALIQAFDRINPKTLAVLSNIVRHTPAIEAMGLGPRFAALRAGAESADTVALYDSRTGKSIPVLAQLAYSGQDVDHFLLDSPATTACRARSTNPWSFFANGSGGFGRQASFVSAVGNQTGYAFHTSGMNLGVDYDWNESSVMGGIVGYGATDATLDDGAGTAQVDSARFGVYGTHFLESGFYVDGYLGGAVNFYKTARAIDFGTIQRTANGTPRGDQLDAQTELGWDYKTKAATFTPLASLAYTRVHRNAFTESGADALDMTVGAMTSDSLRSDAGMRVSRRFTTRTHAWAPRLSAAWEHEYQNQGSAVDAQFASGVGSAFSVPTAEPGRDSAVLGAGLVLQWTSSLSFSLDYNGEVGRTHYYEHSFNGGLHFRF